MSRMRWLVSASAPIPEAGSGLYEAWLQPVPDVVNPTSYKLYHRTAKNDAWDLVYDSAAASGLEVQSGGSTVATRGILNFIGAHGVVDDSGNLRVDVTVRQSPDPDKPPASADAMDDEFNTDKGPGGTALWAWRNQGSATYTVANGNLQISDTGAGESLRILEQTAPSAPWRFRCKLGGGLKNTNYSRAFIGVLRDSDGKNTQHGLAWIDGSRYVIEQYNTVTSWSSRPTSHETAFPFRPIYLEIENDSTNLIYRVSGDGVVFVQTRSETIASWVGTADRIILGVNDLTNSGATSMYEWFRRMA